MWGVSVDGKVRVLKKQFFEFLLNTLKKVLFNDKNVKLKMKPIKTCSKIFFHGLGIFG